MNLMGCRLINLHATYLGYLKTGIPLIGAENEKLYQPITGDDIGIYVLIPKLSAFFNISLESGIHLFFYSLLIIPLFLGIIGFYYLYQRWDQRFISISGLLLITRVAYGIGDVYLASSATAISIIPFGLYMIKSKNKKLPVFALISGLIVGFLHYVRVYSGVAPLIFMAILIIENEFYHVRDKLLFFLIMSIGLFIGPWYFGQAHQQSQDYAHNHLALPEKISNGHVFWHQMYIGLGLLNIKNINDIRYDDSVAAERVKMINPSAGYCSVEYEETLKNEFFKMIKEQSAFIVLTIFAKLGILLYFLIKFANIGLFAALIYRKKFILDFAFLAALSWDAIYCFIAIPLHEYALGFIACAALWGIVSINHGLEMINLELFRSFFRRRYGLVRIFSIFN